MEPRTWPGRTRGAFRRFFYEQENRISPHFVAYLVAVGLIQLGAWVVFLGGLYLLYELWVYLTGLSYSSPKNYLLYSVLPLLAISLVFGIGRVLWEIWDEEVSGSLHRRRRHRKRRAERGRNGGNDEPEG